MRIEFNYKIMKKIIILFLVSNLYVLSAIASLDTDLINASLRGDIKTVTTLLKQGADPKAGGSEALVSAARNGYTAVVKLLLENGANAKAYNSRALKSAAVLNQIDMARFLLEKGADLTEEAMKAAIQFKREKIVELFECTKSSSCFHSEPSEQVQQTYTLKDAVTFFMKTALKNFQINEKLDSNKKQKIEDALVELLNKSEFLFIGQTHMTFDGKVVVDNLELLKANGLTHVAIEIPISEQEGLNHYIATGNTAMLTAPFDKVVESIDCKLVIQRAKELGLEIIAFDDVNAIDLNVPEAEREFNMAKNLDSLPLEGKKLVFTGRNHVTTPSLPFWSAKIYLTQLGRSTSAVSLESFSSIVICALFDKLPEDAAVKMHTAYALIANNYADWLIEGSFAYPTNDLGNLSHANLIWPKHHKTFSYRENYDYVFILNEIDSEMVEI